MGLKNPSQAHGRLQTAHQPQAPIDSAPPSSVTNPASLAANEADLNAANDSASQTTALDNGPSLVTGVDSDPRTADG